MVLEPVVALGIPLYGSVPALCLMQLLNHVAYGVSQGRYGMLSFVEGAYIDHARNSIVAEVLADRDVTHVFFHDQDVLVPETVVPALLGHDVPVVGAVYFGRDPRHLPVAFELEPYRRIEELDLGGLNKVGGVGMGATLIATDLLRAMEARYGDRWWFRCTEPLDGAEGRRTGEDVWFATRCAEMDVPIYLNGAAQCGHVGPVEITAAHYQEARKHG